MPFYIGKSADGSDAKELKGMYRSPDDKEWSSKPYDDTWRPTTRKERRQRERNSKKYK
jgi:hypothetical protein